jgi:hypothetical protein
MFKWSRWPPEFTYSTHPSFTADLPNLLPHLCANEVSAATTDYNCIAWAAAVETDWWEPDQFSQYYWPDGVERKYTVKAYTEAYRTIGYEVCDSPEQEPGFEKVAIFSIQGWPTHACRQLRNGLWTSKLGQLEDIQHETLDCMSGPLYGIPNTYMKRRLA